MNADSHQQDTTADKKNVFHKNKFRYSHAVREPQFMSKTAPDVNMRREAIPPWCLCVLVVKMVLLFWARL